MPYSVDLNDVIAWRKGDEIDAFCRQIRDYFDTLYEEGAEQCIGDGDPEGQRRREEEAVVAVELDFRE